MWKGGEKLRRKGKEKRKEGIVSKPHLPITKSIYQMEGGQGHGRETFIKM